MLTTHTCVSRPYYHACMGFPALRGETHEWVSRSKWVNVMNELQGWAAVLGPSAAAVHYDPSEQGVADFLV